MRKWIDTDFAILYAENTAVSDSFFYNLIDSDEFLEPILDEWKFPRQPLMADTVEHWAPFKAFEILVKNGSLPATWVEALSKDTLKCIVRGCESLSYDSIEPMRILVEEPGFSAVVDYFFVHSLFQKAAISLRHLPPNDPAHACSVYFLDAINGRCTQETIFAIREVVKAIYPTYIRWLITLEIREKLVKRIKEITG